MSRNKTTNRPRAAATDSAPLRWGHSWWDRLPVELRAMILNAMRPLRRFLCGMLAVKAPVRIQTTRAIWRDAFTSNWLGDLDLLPAIVLDKTDTALVRSRSLYHRLCAIFPSNGPGCCIRPEFNEYNVGDARDNRHFTCDECLHHIPMRNGWFDLLDFSLPIAMGWAAMRCGCPELLEHVVQEHGIDVALYDEHLYTSAMDVAALGGSISILETLHKAGRDATGIINTAAHSGHLGAVIWAYEHGDPTGGYTAIANAALGGHLDIAQWLHKHDYYVTSRACDAAAENGHLHIMEWFHANGLDGFTSDAMDDAAAGGHLDVVKWFHANSSAGCTKNAMRFAIRRGHDDVVVFLAQHRPEVALLVTDALLAVVKANSPSRVKQLYTTKPESYTQAAFREACREGHVRIVRFFLKHEHGFDADMLQAAAAKDPSVAGIMMDSMSLDAARAMLEDVAGKGKEYAATKRRLETLVKRLLVAQIRVGMSKHKRATN